ncbi:MAG: hypothetical protein RLZZ200_186 [Pseudomonadota bacterium]
MKLALARAATALTLVLAAGAAPAAPPAARPAAAMAATVTLDRAALLKLADDYFAALVAHDPRRVPFAPDAKFVENLSRMQPGDGLWKTAASAPASFKLVVPDTTWQSLAFIVMMEESVEGRQNPIEVGGRLQLANGRIVEAEHVVVHQVRETSLKNLQKVRAPLLADVGDDYRDARGRLLYIGRRYYDALDLNNGRLAPLADDCVRMENGMQTSRNVVPTDVGGATATPGSGPSLIGALTCAAQLDTQTFTYIDSIDNIRMVAADEQKGLVVGFSHFRHSMKAKEYHLVGIPGRETYTMNFAPFDLPAVHLYKIWNGQIHEIEALGFTTGYMSKTGWE